MRALLALSLLAAGCNENGVLQDFPVPDLTMQLTSPTYGMFVGHGDLVVEGVVSSPDTVLVVEGERVFVRKDGTFRHRVPVDHPYRIIEVSADLYGQHLEERLPVFDGTDPSESYPGALTLRLTETGLAGISMLLGGVVDGLLTQEAILQAIPPLDVSGWGLRIDSVTHAPTQVGLEPSEAGVLASVQVDDLVFGIMAYGDLFGFPVELPATLTLPEVGVDLLVGTGIGEAGDIVLAIGEPDVSFDTPGLSIGGLGLEWLADLLLGNLDIGALITDAVAGGLGDLGEISLGEPLALDTDLLGIPMSLSVAEVTTDDDGVGLGLGLGLGAEAATLPLPIPYPSGNFTAPADLAVAVHDGLLAPVLDSDLLSMLEQDITLPGFLGGFLGGIVKALPGGDQAPEGAGGWCLSLKPGEAKVARFHQGTSPLLGIYFPDAIVKFGAIADGETTCTDWLVASIALEVGVGIDGTALDLGLAAPEGKILSYGASGVDEAAVIAGLGNQLSSLINLLGGLTGLDLESLFDLDALLGDSLGGLGLEPGALQLQIREVRPMLDAGGQPIDGLWEFGVQLFGTSTP